MELFRIALSSLGSIVVLFFLTKLIGNREMSQLSMFDYINSITIGSIAAELATSLEDDFAKPLVAMIVYAIVIFLLAIFTSKSMKARSFITGKSLLLFNNGKLYIDNFKKATLDMNEFLTQCRIAGYFNLSDVDTILLEPNGKLSFIPLSLKRPVTPEDLKLLPSQEKRVLSVIIDGKIIKENLKEFNINEKWITTELKKQKIQNISNIFLATCDLDRNLSIYIK